MALLTLGAGSWDSMLSNWLKSPMTDLNPPQRQHAPCQLSTQQGAAQGCQSPKKTICRGFFFGFFFYFHIKKNNKFFIFMFKIVIVIY